MGKNRFESVDEPQPDALNLTLRQTGEGQVGIVHVPTSALGGKLDKSIDSGEIPAVDAFRSAIKLANELSVAIVVIDPDNVWREEWGDLYRDDDSDPGHVIGV
jgi:hypothetical protein